MPDGATPAAPGDTSKGAGKGRAKAKPKAECKGAGKGNTSDGVGAAGASDPAVAEGHPADQVEETTPLQKAKALAKSVFPIFF